MATTTIQKRKKKVQSLKDILDWARKELYKAAELFTKRKSEVILETARKLEDSGIEKSKISTEIAKGLEGFVDDSYVQKVLKDYPQYKNQKKAKSGKSRRNIPAKSSQKEPTKQTEEKVVQESETTGDENAPTGYYEMPVKDFRIKDIQLYDRDFLLQIIVHLFDRLPEEVQKEYK